MFLWVRNILVEQVTVKRSRYKRTNDSLGYRATGIFNSQLGYLSTFQVAQVTFWLPWATANLDPWLSDTSLSFSIDQVVRQGGVLSTHLCKQYINELLNNLENHNIGISIGNTYAGCSTCADDIVLLSKCRKC
jgi:hypothetical protein